LRQILKNKQVLTLVVVAALGYFVDIYDLILFSIVRVKSLKALGLSGDELMTSGLMLLNVQMIGMLLGGIFWGVWGDKRGRLSVLFGSICLYSVANIANGLVGTVSSYALWRFVAGLGLAGELGAGITLVSESLPKETRGYGTMLVATIGILGAVAAVLVGDLLDWRASYFVGGGLGLALLLLRVSVFESGLYTKLSEKPVARGHFKTLFRTRRSAVKYIACIGMGLPCWFVVGILVSFAPEFGKALGMAELPSAGQAVMYCYLGLALGDFISGSLSQLARSRRKVVAGFLVLTGVFIALYLSGAGKTVGAFYGVCLGMGFSVGYWAVLVTVAAEQFGTNIRSTVATTVPNFVRGMLVPITAAFQAMKPSMGILGAAGAVGAFCVLGALLSIFVLEETHHKDLDYIEAV
jgi:MFS transporter, putative metabolite:H+ symporter